LKQKNNENYPIEIEIDYDYDGIEPCNDDVPFGCTKFTEDRARNAASLMYDYIMAKHAIGDNDPIGTAFDAARIDPSETNLSKGEFFILWSHLRHVHKKGKKNVSAVKEFKWQELFGALDTNQDDQISKAEMEKLSDFATKRWTPDVLANLSKKFASGKPFLPNNDVVQTHSLNNMQTKWLGFMEDDTEPEAEAEGEATMIKKEPPVGEMFEQKGKSDIFAPKVELSPEEEAAFAKKTALDFHASTKCHGKQSEQVVCADLSECPIEPPHATDCEWGHWIEWNTCPCQNPMQTRLRSIKTHGVHGGVVCEGPSMEERECTPESSVCGTASINCGFGPWSDWDMCSKSCDGGQHGRVRVIVTHATGDGLQCEGPLKELKPCNEHSCGEDRDCLWGEWVSYGSSCNVSCGGGHHKRSRMIQAAPLGRGKLCDPNDMSDLQPCNEQPCDGQVDCNFSEWENWSECYGGCDNAVRHRSRSIAQHANKGKGCEGALSESEECTLNGCLTEKIPCKINEWTQWSDCTCPCNGVKHRTRTIEPARNGGPGCADSLSVVESCNVHSKDCAVEKTDCVIGSWSEWGEPQFAVGQCGTGQEHRSRKIEVDAAGGGTPCDGFLAETREVVKKCETTNCVWGEWDGWNSCTEYCGGGQQSRRRAIMQEASLEGKPCEAKDSHQTQECNTMGCPEIKCKWGPWSDWTKSDATCGNGRRERTRTHRLEGPMGPVSESKVTGAHIPSCPTDEQIEVSSIKLDPCENCEPVDCKFSDWSEWGDCSCAAVRGRHRVISEYPTCGGQWCNGPTEENQRCIPTCHQENNLDCRYSPWTEWSACDKQCSDGNKLRLRSVTQHNSGTGTECNEDLGQETQSCHSKDCKADIDCTYSEWSAWSECSHTCGGGSHERHRDVSTHATQFGKQCNEHTALKELKECNVSQCPSKKMDCSFSEWGEWTVPGAKCAFSETDADAGMQYRSRSIAVQAAHGGKPCEGNMQEFSPMELPLCPQPDPVDCTLSVWSPWSDCSCACNGHQTRLRKISQTANHGGKLCDGSLQETQPCNVGSDACGLNDVDCVLSQWVEWTPCRLPKGEGCGQGQSKRSRFIETVARDHGIPCEGSLEQLKGCSLECPKPQDCLWEEWSQWGKCSEECEGGQQSRHRDVGQEAKFGGKECVSAASVELRPCNEQACPGKFRCRWAEWSQWEESITDSKTQSSCGIKPMQRARDKEVVPKNAKPTEEFQNLLTACQGTQTDLAYVNFGACPMGCEAIDCDFAQWSEWSACSCEKQTQDRRRGVETYAVCGGKLCNGDAIVSRPCSPLCKNLGTIAECGYSEWTPWSGCPVTCGGGHQQRYRSVLVHSSGGGAPCDKVEEDRNCETLHCPAPRDCEYSPFEEWSTCTVSCGGGQQARVRQVVLAAQNGGKPCEALTLREVRGCNEDKCKVPSSDCVLSEWSNWDICNLKCGGGLQQRKRTIVQTMLGEGKPCGFDIHKGDKSDDSTDSGLLQEFRGCNERSCDPSTDCTFASWNDWGSCSAECNGHHLRSRSVAVEEQNGGALCNGPLTQIYSCHVGAASCSEKIQDCLLSKWSVWKPCSVSCGSGQQNRSRSILQEPLGQGKECPNENLSETRPCNNEPCTKMVNCEWGQWGLWDKCTRPCGGGQKTRHRSISVEPHNGGEPCSANSIVEVDPCGEEPCKQIYPKCGWSTWAEWTVFGGVIPSCGMGQYERTRHRLILNQDEIDQATPSKELNDLVGACGGEQKEVKTEELGVCKTCTPVDCSYNSWSEWGACGCDAIQKRQRVVFQYPSCQGTLCNETLEEIRPCEPKCWKMSDIDCEYSNWTEWAACSATCGSGTMYRLRTVTTHSEGDGIACSVEDGKDLAREEQKCPFIEACPQAVDCVYSDWQSWSSCSNTCGGGTRTRARLISTAPEHGGVDCKSGNMREIESCNKESCDPLVNRDCVLSKWSNFGTCTAKCGGGYKLRTRAIDVTSRGDGRQCEGKLQDWEPCNSDPCGDNVNCSFGKWELWSACSQPCNGHKSRRRIVGQQAQGDGKQCVGSLEEVEPCEVNSAACGGGSPRDAVVGSWSIWSDCSKSCDGGQMSRVRKIEKEAMHGGKAAVVSLSEVDACNAQPCTRVVDCTWGPWDLWSSCSHTCGGGQKERNRSLALHASPNGKPCEAKASHEVTVCALDLCPNDKGCVMDDWGGWAACSTSCDGQTTRERRWSGDTSMCNSFKSIVATQPCNVGACASTCIDDVWGPWGVYSECSCLGLQQRSRDLTTQGNACGKRVFGPTVENKSCHPQCHENVDCVMGAWGNWATCTRSCDGGQTFRSRVIEKEPLGLGKLCNGPLLESLACNIESCGNPVDCIMGPFEEWTECSRPCGGGEQLRARKMTKAARNGGQSCEKKFDSSEVLSCNPQPCPKGAKPADCVFTNWSEWSLCSASCAGGFKSRSRFVQSQPMEGGKPCVGKLDDYDSCNDISCNPNTVNGAFSQWSAWGICSCKCHGTRGRERTIQVYNSEGGKPVTGGLKEVGPCGEDCSDGTPDVDCKLSEWGPWGECSRTCDNGHRFRERDITRMNSGNGKGCGGDLKEVSECATNSCHAAIDCKFGDWSECSSCSMSCGGGESSRHRVIEQEPHLGGKSCDSSDLIAVQACNTQDCFQHQYCTWSPWLSWTTCTASCGAGIIKRSREMGATSNKPPVMLNELNMPVIPTMQETATERFFAVFGMFSMVLLSLTALYKTSRSVGRQRATTECYDQVEMGTSLLTSDQSHDAPTVRDDTTE